MKHILAAVLLIAAWGCLPGPQRAAASETAAPASEQALVGAYEQFKALFAAGKYAESVPLAEEVVRLTETAGIHPEELPTAYNNLGAAQLRAGDAAGAEESFRAALDLLEKTESISSRRLIAPLGGLGTAYAALGRHDLAAAALGQAIAISRRSNGLFNLEQLDLLEALIRSHLATGNYDAVDRERRYAVQVVQQKYGYDDPRTVPMVLALGRWFEASERYALARLQYARIVTVASAESGGRNAATIDGLLGIARTHRLQFGLDPQSLIVEPAPASQFEQPDWFRVTEESTTQRITLDPNAKRAAQQALDILDGIPDPPADLLRRTLIELGDLNMVDRDIPAAHAFYARASPLAQGSIAEMGDDPLANPRVLVYRKPPGALRSRYLPLDGRVTRRAVFSLTVSPTGKVSEVQFVDGDLDEARAGQIVRALDRATFSPRIQDAKPVEAQDVRFAEVWYERATGETAPAADQPDTGDTTSDTQATPDAGTEPLADPESPAPTP